MDSSCSREEDRGAPAGWQTLVCPTHGLIRDIYCVYDKQLICSECTNDHYGHPTRLVSDEVLWMRGELENVCMELERRSAEGSEMLKQVSSDDSSGSDTVFAMADIYSSERESDVTASHVSVEKLIRTDFAMLRAALDRREEELLQKFAAINSTEIAKHAHSSRIRIDKFMKACLCLSEKAQSALSSATDLDLLGAGPAILQSISDLRSTADSLSMEPRYNPVLDLDYHLETEATAATFLSLGVLCSHDVAPKMCRCVVGTSEAYIKESKNWIDLTVKDYQDSLVEDVSESIQYFAVQFKQCEETESSDYQIVEVPFNCIQSGPGECRIDFSTPPVGEYKVLVSFCGQMLGERTLKLVVKTVSNWVFGSKGSGPGQFTVPWGICIGANDQLFVSDSGTSRVDVFNVNDGSYIRSIGSYGRGEEDLHSPRGVYASDDGSLYVVDAGNCRIQVYDQLTGEHITQLFEKGSGPGYLCGPWGVVVGSDNNIYVTDMNNHSIEVCTRGGTFLRSIGRFDARRRLLYPRGICCSADGILFVAYLSSHRFQIFRIETSEFIAEAGDSDCSPMDISLGVDGNVYVTDFDKGSIAVFGGDGSIIRRVCTKGVGLMQLRSPCGLCCASNGSMYIADAGNFRIQVLHYLKV